MSEMQYDWGSLTSFQRSSKNYPDFEKIGALNLIWSYNSCLKLKISASRLTFESRASGEEQSDPAGRSLVKRRQESELALISVFFHFCFA